MQILQDWLARKKCDSVREGCSYGVTCKYIDKAKSQGKVQCNEDGSIWRIQHKISDVTVAAIYFMNDILKKIIASMTFVTNAEKR